MTPEEAVARAREIVANNNADIEAQHYGLDELLCEVLRSLGYGELVGFYESTERWFS